MSQCTNCDFLRDQCIELRNEISILHGRIDLKLSEILVRETKETKEIAIQTKDITQKQWRNERPGYPGRAGGRHHKGAPNS